jgi:acyl carrier protein
MLDESDIRTIVGEEIAELLGDRGAGAPDSGKSLHELGISSLMLARLIIMLESRVGVDPFAEDVPIADVRSVDDLIHAYSSASRAQAKAAV